MSTTEVQVDLVLNELGPLGVFACVQCFLFFLTFVTSAQQHFSFVFTGKDVEHRCAPPSNESEAFIPEMADEWLNSTSITYEQCSIDIKTNISADVTMKQYTCVFGMEYDEPKDSSLVSEWDLVCERQALAALTQTLLSLGWGLGSSFWSWMSDLYGRRLMLIVTLTLTHACNLLAGLAPSYAVFVISKLGQGFVISGADLMAVTAGVELFPSKWRALTSGWFSTLWWASCIASLAPLAFLLRFQPWKTLQLTLSWSATLLIPMILLLKEPLPWLAAKGKTKEAEGVIRRAARWNRKDPNPILQLFRHPTQRYRPTTERLLEAETPVDGDVFSINAAKEDERHGGPTGDGDTKEDERHGGPTGDGDTKEDERHGGLTGDGDTKQGEMHGPAQEDKKEEKLGFLDLFRHRLLRKNILLIWFMWLVDIMTYNAMYLLSDTLALSLYTAFFLNAAVEGASCFFMIIMLKRWGRKTTLAIFHVVSALGLLMSGICFNFEDNYSLQILGTVASLCGKMGIGGAFNMLYLYTPEIFPTSIRNRALGTAASVATVGEMIAPFSDVLVDYALWAPGALFGMCSLLAAFFLLALPESKGRELPQTVSDLEAWYE